jgi:hypothetical protein
MSMATCGNSHRKANAMSNPTAQDTDAQRLTVLQSQINARGTVVPADANSAVDRALSILSLRNEALGNRQTTT